MSETSGTGADPSDQPAPSDSDTGAPAVIRSQTSDRRSLLKKAAVAGSIVWLAPTLSSITTPAAAASCATSTVVTLVPTCLESSTPVQTCTTFLDQTVAFCRDTPARRVLLARDPGGLREPYFDELGVLTVTPPGGGTPVIWNFIFWQNQCRNLSASNTLTLTGRSPCGTTTNPAIDITTMFGAATGVFTVRLQVRNFASPYGWAPAFLVPA